MNSIESQERKHEWLWKGKEEDLCNNILAYDSRILACLICDSLGNIPASVERNHENREQLTPKEEFQKRIGPIIAISSAIFSQAEGQYGSVVYLTVTHEKVKISIIPQRKFGMNVLMVTPPDLITRDLVLNIKKVMLNLE